MSVKIEQAPPAPSDGEGWRSRFAELQTFVEQYLFHAGHARARRATEAKERKEAEEHERQAAAALDDLVLLLERWLGPTWMEALRLLSRRNKAIAAVEEALKTDSWNPDDRVELADGDGSGVDLDAADREERPHDD